MTTLELFSNKPFSGQYDSKIVIYSPRRLQLYEENY